MAEILFAEFQRCREGVLDVPKGGIQQEFVDLQHGSRRVLH
jgi:hypothetical protein